MIRVLVVDDQSLIRQAVVDILGGDAEIEVIGEGMNGRDALRMSVETRPDVVLMDIRMPEMDGIAATEQICAHPDLAETRVLILTTFEEDEYVVAALRAGASGFIGKGAEPDEIARAVRSVASGDALLSPVATRALITRYLHPESDPADDGALDQLTEREREVLLLVAKGWSNQEIADGLFISPHTAKTHVSRIMTKLQAHDRAQLVIVAYESGLLAPGG